MSECSFCGGSGYRFGGTVPCNCKSYSPNAQPQEHPHTALLREALARLEDVCNRGVYTAPRLPSLIERICAALAEAPK